MISRTKTGKMELSNKKWASFDKKKKKKGLKSFKGWPISYHVF